MSESPDVSVKSRKSYETLATNGGLDNSFGMQCDPSSVSNQRNQWVPNSEDRKSLVLWKRPFTTLQYFLKEIFVIFNEYGSKYVSCLHIYLRFCILVDVSF